MRHDVTKTDNPLVKKLAANETALCLAVRLLRLPHVAHMAKAAGFEAIYYDMEHSAISAEDCSRLCIAAWDIGVTPLVRVPSKDAHGISAALDGGAAGVIVPHVDTADEAQAIAEAALFPPLGKRSVAGSGVGLAYAALPPADAYAKLNERTLVIAMLESEEGIANAGAIAATPGIDMLLIGTNDLCAEFGIHGQLDHPKVLAAYEAVAKACKAHGCTLGIGGIKSGAMLADLHKLGARFLLGRTDEALLLASTKNEVTSLRKTFG